MKKKISITTLILALIISFTTITTASVAIAVTANGPAINKTEWVPDQTVNLPDPDTKFYTVTIGNRSLEYIVQMPRVRNFDGAGIDSLIKYPLLISLHGSGGDQYLARYKTEKMEYGILLDHLSRSYEFPFISIHPLMPRIADGTRHSWKSVEDLVMKAFDETVNKYSVDLNKVYLTGFSLGGYGTYDLALDFPNKFAACVVGAGGHEVKDAPRLAKIPFWIFHGVGDFIVPYQEDQAMAEELQYQTSDQNVIFTSLPVGHTLTAEVYSETTFNWMLTKTLRTDVTAPLTPDVNVVYSNSSIITGSLLGELGSKVIVKSNDKILGFGYIDVHNEFLISIPKQLVGTKIYITVEDAFKNVSPAKEVIVKLNPIPTKPIVKTASSTKITGTAQSSCRIIVKLRSKIYASGKTSSTGAFTLKYKSIKKGSILSVISVRNGKSSAITTVKVK